MQPTVASNKATACCRLERDMTSPAARVSYSNGSLSRSGCGSNGVRAGGPAPYIDFRRAWPTSRLAGGGALDLVSRRAERSRPRICRCRWTTCAAARYPPPTLTRPIRRRAASPTPGAAGATILCGPASPGLGWRSSPPLCCPRLRRLSQQCHSQMPRRRGCSRSGSLSKGSLQHDNRRRRRHLLASSNPAGRPACPARPAARPARLARQQSLRTAESWALSRSLPSTTPCQRAAQTSMLPPLQAS
jgi:hypothetical protein